MKFLLYKIVKNIFNVFYNIIFLVFKENILVFIFFRFNLNNSKGSRKELVIKGKK